MSNYPEGVTGAEDHIAGPRGEYIDTREVDCVDCDTTWEADVPVTLWSDRRVYGWECPSCHAIYDREEYL